MTTPITSVAEFKAYAGITSSNQDLLIGTLITPCMKAIGAFCNRHFDSQQITSYRNGNGSTGMMMANYPVTSIQSLTIDDNAIPQSPRANVAGWFLPPTGRRIILRGYTFTRGDRNVVISYTAGYGDASGTAGADVAPWPDDLKNAMHIYLLARLRERDRIGVGSKSLAGEAITIPDAASGTSGSSQGIPNAARIVLENYLNTIPETDD